MRLLLYFPILAMQMQMQKKEIPVKNNLTSPGLKLIGADLPKRGCHAAVADCRLAPAVFQAVAEPTPSSSMQRRLRQ